MITVHLRVTRRAQE